MSAEKTVPCSKEQGTPDCQKTIVLSLRDPAGVVAAQPLAALPPYGCGVPLAGAISQNNIASCMFSGKYEIFLIREALNKSARAVSERFCSELRFENRRNTLCISRFSNRKVGTKDPLSAAADLFRASLDRHVAALLAMTRRGLFRHAEAGGVMPPAFRFCLSCADRTPFAVTSRCRDVSAFCEF